MLQYIKGRFHLAGASFAMPDGFFIEPTPLEPTDNGFMLFSPDDKYVLTISFSEESQPTDAILNSLFSKEYGLEPFQPIAPIEINGLTGHCALYHGGRDQYYEARFQLTDDYHLVVLIRTEPEIGIKSIVNTKTLHEILSCVRKD